MARDVGRIGQHSTFLISVSILIRYSSIQLRVTNQNHKVRVIFISWTTRGTDESIVSGTVTLASVDSRFVCSRPSNDRWINKITSESTACLCDIQVDSTRRCRHDEP